MRKLLVFVFGTLLVANQVTIAQTKRVTCDGILVEVDMISGADFPMSVVYDNATEQCWMETEQGNKSLPLDKRAKVVDKCVKDKMSGAK